MKYEIFIHYIIYIIYIYTFGTILEYILHKYLMHKSNSYYSNSHIIHHKHIDEKTMNIINEDDFEYIKIKPSENLTFETCEILGIIISFSLAVYLFKKYYPVKLNLNFLIIFPTILIIFSVLIWNSFHPYMHGKFGGDYNCISLPKQIVDKLSNTLYIKWVIKNHICHHRIKGDKKGNYNVTLPGADFLFNSYNKC